jgi:hypothetical protein
MQEQYQSLFDYLGKPAGTDLGQQVFTESKKQGVKTTIREVKTKNYEGKVMVYPTSFLENYFNPQPTQPNVFDDLPF